MNLSSCRALKAEILERACSVPGETLHARPYKLRKSRGRWKNTATARVVTSVAAIGVAPSRGRDYKLAIRVFRGFERHAPALLRGFERHAGEIDLVVGVRYRPRLTLRPGGSIGHFKITAGTLGGFVEDADLYYMLSNNHVFANGNCAFGGDPVLQPGPSDITGSFKQIGDLDHWYPLSTTDKNGVDAALARFTDEVDFFEPWDYPGVGRIKKACGP